MPLNFPSNPTISDTYTSAGTTWTFDGTAWNVTSGVGGGGGGESNQNAFSNVAVSGQSTIAADTTTDTLNLVAGSNITIITDAETDSVTINSTASGGGGSSNSFETIAVGGQDSVIAESSTDTLNLAAGSGISITTNAGTDTITLANTAQGVTGFSNLTDATSASLTIDKIYLPAITMLITTNNGASAYRFDQYSTTNNPTIYAINGTTIAFNLNVAGHPFLIQSPAGASYDVGLVHVTTDGTVTTGASAQGKTSGTLYWKIPDSISGNYRYQCSVHGVMIGIIAIKNFVSI